MGKNSLFCLLLTLLGSIPGYAEPLRGGITIDNLQAGMQFTERMLPASEHEWIEIPEWMAGTWELHQSTVRGPSGTVIEPGYSIGSWGMQRDKYGSIWHILLRPSVTKTRLPAGMNYGIVHDEQYSSSGSAVIGTALIQHLSIDQAGRVSEVGTVRHRKTMRLLDGKLYCVDRIYGDARESHTVASKVRQFVPRETYKGINCRESLATFLRAHHMADRVPD